MNFHDSYLELMKNHTENSPFIFLKLENRGTELEIGIEKNIDEAISEYAFQKLNLIHQIIENTNNDGEVEDLKKIANIIYNDYDKYKRQENLLSRIYNRVLVALNLRHSREHIYTVHQLTQKEKSSLPFFDSQLHEEFALGESFSQDGKKIQKLVDKYAPHSLSQLINTNEDSEIQEMAVLSVYENELNENIRSGYYNPALIPFEMNFRLGPPRLATNIKSFEDLEKELIVEIDSLPLTNDQKKWLGGDMRRMMEFYFMAYPDKSLQDGFVVGRDLIRIAAYQELQNPDRGIEWLHKKLKINQSLHAQLSQKDYNLKDRFIEGLVHFYEGIGSTAALAAKSPSCQEDQFFLSAKVIEENVSYFVYYLDASSYHSLHKCVLFQKIFEAKVDLNEQLDDFNPKMVRSLTSIARVNAERMEPEFERFFSMPVAITAITRLQLFLSEYRQYEGIFANPEINQQEWLGLNPENPLDVLAHDVFQSCKTDLLRLAQQFSKGWEKEIQHNFSTGYIQKVFKHLGVILTDVNLLRKKNGSGMVFQVAIKPGPYFAVMNQLRIPLGSYIPFLKDFGGYENLVRAVLEQVRGRRNDFSESLEFEESIYKITAAQPIENEGDLLGELKAMHQRNQIIEDLKALRARKALRAEYLLFLQDSVYSKLGGASGNGIIIIRKLMNFKSDVGNKPSSYERVLKTDRDWESTFGLFFKIPGLEREIFGLMEDLEKLKSTGISSEMNREKYEEAWRQFTALAKSQLAREDHPFLDEIISLVQTLLILYSEDYQTAEKEFEQIVDIVKLTSAGKHYDYLLKGISPSKESAAFSVAAHLLQKIG